MQGDRDIIRLLNAVLTNELTAVNQYFLHARMFESWGLKHLARSSTTSRSARCGTPTS